MTAGKVKENEISTIGGYNDFNTFTGDQFQEGTLDNYGAQMREATFANYK
jgi:hypothetical protein